MIAEEAVRRNNITVTGSGEQTLVLAHGFGCDQTMWRFLEPLLLDSYRIVKFDYVGSGRSDPKAFSEERYASLDGYAQDIIDVCEATEITDAVLIGHSVSSMTGLIASIRAPERIAKLVMICPSPSFLNDPPDYHGGFERGDIDELIGLMNKNYIGWANHLAHLVMGLDGENMVDELSGSFCSTDPLFARIFATATFYSDCRGLLTQSDKPTLVLQSSDDALASISVGQFILSQMANARMEVLAANGHCLHMTHADQIAPVIDRFIRQ